MRPCERAGTDHPSRSANYAHKNKQRRELRQDSTKRQVQVQTHSPRTRHRMVCVAHTRTRTSGRKVQKTSARRHSLSAWAENDGVSRVLHGSLRRESQLCRLPKQQWGTPHGQDNENDGKAIRQINRTHYKYDPLRHIYHDTHTSDASISYMDMPCKIGARMSCKQRRKLYAVITQLHTRLRRCGLN